MEGEFRRADNIAPLDLLRATQKAVRKECDALDGMEPATPMEAVAAVTIGRIRTVMNSLDDYTEAD